MNWQQFWDKQAAQPHTLQQVGRNGITSAAMEQLMKEQADFIAEKAGMHGTETVLDVCCGNGAFTNELGLHCGHITGIDLSPAQIRHAREKWPDRPFDVVNILKIGEWDEYEKLQHHFDVITLCFSFQYFDTVEKGFMAIKGLLPLLKKGGRLMLTDVPDRARFFNHYNNLPKIAGLVVQMAKGKNVMGKFWAEDEMAFICGQLEVQGEKIQQPKHFPYAHYRMDYLITKP